MTMDSGQIQGDPSPKFWTTRKVTFDHRNNRPNGDPECQNPSSRRSRSLTCSNKPKAAPPWPKSAGRLASPNRPSNHSLLPVEEKVRRYGRRRAASPQTARKGEQETQVSRCRPNVGRAHAARGNHKKALRPAQKKELVSSLTVGFKIGIRRACDLVRQNRSTNYYQSQAKDQTALRIRLRDLAASRVRYGYRRLHILLQRKGWESNGRPIGINPSTTSGSTACTSSTAWRSGPRSGSAGGVSQCRRPPRPTSAGAWTSSRTGSSTGEDSGC